LLAVATAGTDFHDRKNTVIGTQLGNGSARREKWRQTVALTQHEDVVIDRLELLYNGEPTALLDQVMQDIGTVHA